MERDEEATYAEFERLKRELIEPSLSRHEGRLIKTTGDGALVEFASPLAALPGRPESRKVAWWMRFASRRSSNMALVLADPPGAPEPQPMAGTERRPSGSVGTRREPTRTLPRWTTGERRNRTRPRVNE